MARVPDYSGRRVATRPVGAQGFSMRAPDASGLARGLEQVESGFMRRVEEERQKADTAAVMEADRQLTEWQNSTMFDPERGVYTRKGSNALDVTNQTLQEFDKAQSKIGETLKGDQQRLRYQEIVNRRRQSFSGDLNRYEFQERQRYYDQVDQGQIETSMQSAALYYNDPEKIAYFQNKMAAVLQAQALRKGLPEEAAQAELLNHNSALSKAVINRMAVDDPYKAREYYQQAIGAMTAEDQIQVDRMIDREIKARELHARQMQAIARVELTSRVQDAEAAYLQGLDFAQPPSRQEFIGAYGADEGAQRYDQFLKVQQVGSSIRELATASPEERNAVIDRFNPAENGIAGEGFAQDARLYGTVIKAATDLEREKQTDPAGYAAKYSPVIRGALQALESGDPSAAESYAAATLAEQERMGVAEPRLLSRSQAKAIVSQFTNTEDGGSNSAAMVEQLKEQWGKHWPTVYRQLAAEDLPGAALVIGSGVDQNTASILARIAPLKDADLKRGLEPTEISDGKELLRDELAPLRLTLAQQAGGDRTYATLDREAERLMLAHLAQGKSPKDAVKAVTKALVDDKYTVKGSWRAPIEYDADLIERGAELAIEAVDPMTLQFSVPAGVDAEFAAGRVKAAIEKDGYWVTNPDETGLVLYYGGAAVLDKDGNPVERGFEELMGESIANPSAWQRFNEGRRSMRQGPVRAGEAMGR